MFEQYVRQCLSNTSGNAFGNAWEGCLAKHATQRNATNATTLRQPERNLALETRANNPVDNKFFFEWGVA